MRLRASVVVATVAVALTSGCDPSPGSRPPDAGGNDVVVDAGVDAGLPELPQALLDRLTLAFGQEFGRGVYAGTRVTETLQVRNGGRQDLVVSAARVTGPDASVFSLQSSGPSAASLESLFFQVQFTPTRTGAHAATLEVVSNAEHAATMVIPLRATVVELPGGAP